MQPEDACFEAACEACTREVARHLLIVWQLTEQLHSIQSGTKSKREYLQKLKREAERLHILLELPESATAPSQTFGILLDVLKALQQLRRKLSNILELVESVNSSTALSTTISGDRTEIFRSLASKCRDSADTISDELRDLLKQVECARSDYALPPPIVMPTARRRIGDDQPIAPANRSSSTIFFSSHEIIFVIRIALLLLIAIAIRKLYLLSWI